MNIFILILAGFAAIGLIDLMIGGKMGLAEDFEKGLANMGGLALSIVGFYAVCVPFVQNHAAAITEATAFLPFDPSLVFGCLLAPDMGAFRLAQNLAATPSLAVFSGALVAGGLGMTIGYQLPVFLAAVKKDEISDLMQGFIFGLITLAPGLIVGGLLLKIPVAALFLNLIPILALSLLLIGAFVKFPTGTRKVLTVFGNLIRIISFGFFLLAAAGVFIPSISIVDQESIKEILYMILRMVLVATGGMVVSNLVLRFLPGAISRAAVLLGVNNEAVIGLFLSIFQSLAMLPLFSRMDRRGKVLNAAFSVCGAYVAGGQMAFVSSLTDGGQLLGYFACKIISGVLAVACAALFADRKKAAIKEPMISGAVPNDAKTVQKAAP